MTTSVAQRLQQWLIDNGHAVDVTVDAGSAWPVFLGTLPDDVDVVDSALAVYDTSGETDGRIHRTGETIVHPGWQIRVRSMDYGVGYSKALEIAVALDGLKDASVTIGGTAFTIATISRKGSILTLGQEPNGKRRQSFTVNGIATL